MDLSARLEEMLAPPADRLLDIFFSHDSVFAGTTFDSLAPNPGDRFVSSDLVAVSLLDRRFAPRAVRAILDTQADSLSAHLRDVPDDVDLWDASDDDIARADRLYKVLRSGGDLLGVGPTTASKLLARKRPRLIPIVDSVIRDALQLHEKNSWLELRAALQQRGLPDRIESIRPVGLASDISTLRLLDATVWMLHSRGREARRARERVGLVGDDPFSRV